MANQSKKKTEEPQPGDPLFNLKHAQAEAAMEQTTDDFGPVTNQYTSDEEQEEIRDAGPRDSQGFRRGEDEPPVIGSNAASR